VARRDAPLVTYLAVPAILAGIYHLIALLAALRRARASSNQESKFHPAISILKPIHGRDPKFYEAIRSHAVLDYPEFEILFGLNDPDDAARADIARLAAEFPQRTIRLIECPPNMPNAKVASMAELARAAKYPVLVINDSDIVVEKDYLRAVVAPLEDPKTGLVTCLYRASGESWPARWEALGIATDFAPSVLVARAIGVAEFALGSTMAIRASDLERIGGFAAIGDYLADDYQLGLRITKLGCRIVLAPAVVETRLSDDSWTAVWGHQVRWSRTIRVSRTSGYFGYVITNASLWALVAAAAGAWPIAAAALAMRLVAGVVTGRFVLGDRDTARLWFLIPFRDLWGFAVWMAGLGGSTVEWRGIRLRLNREGRIVKE
jgi:ceramide glucosyltransferase